MSAPPLIPSTAPKAWELLEAAAKAGHAAAWRPGQDTCGCPFVVVQILTADHREARATWHTHDGGVRYTSGLIRSYSVDWRTGVSLRALREHMEAS